MSYSLVGPYPFDVNAVTTCARQALGAVGSALDAGRGTDLLDLAASGDEPGLYVVLSHRGPDDTDPRIAGFWVIFGIGYFDDGVAGPPERHPPYAQALLDAATEEVWWRSLRVSGHKRGTWNPIIVLEWKPEMAVRATLYPPGVHSLLEDDEESLDDLPAAGPDGLPEVDHDEYGDWLGDQDAGDAAVAEVAAQIELSVDDEDAEPEDAGTADVDADLPEQRSLVSVIYGQMTHDSITHRGQFQLLVPDQDADRDHALPLEAWIEERAKAQVNKRKKRRRGQDEEEPHRIGPPLLLPSDRLAFPLSGWLTRSLDMWPPRPNNLQVGGLTDRIVQSRWQSQAFMGLSSTLAVFVLVLLVSIVVRIATVPRPRPRPTTPPPAAQPAMSVCSADHHKFVTEFRCQIRRFSGEGVEGSACSDFGSEQVVETTVDDLRALYCGLLDRQRDGWVGNFPDAGGDKLYNFAELAASQACFNVLGHPHPYTQETGYGSSTWALADPDLLLQDPSLRIQSLRDLVGDLEGACETYRTRLEHRVEGAIFATHIGALGDPASASEGVQLRHDLIDHSMVGTADDAERAFRMGTIEGLEVIDYAELAGEPDSVVERLNRKKIWVQLAGSPAPSTEPTMVIPQYVTARFGESLSGETTSLWRCHLSLAGMAQGLDRPRVPTRWDLTAPVPSSYDISGKLGIQDQLALDAALLEFENGLNAGTCWEVVDKRLDRYAPVHPLVAELDDGIWISPEQQLCGQICAAFYMIDAGDNVTRWVTRDGDLSRCLSAAAPRTTPDLGRGSLDRLRIPWNGTQTTGWIKPSAAEICAFNLIAQDYMPAAGEDFLVGGKAPAQWAGETATGSRIAGGDDGLAYKGAQNLSSYGRSRSSNTCGYVAAQCFTGLLVDIIGKGRHERYEWRDTWMDRLVDLHSATPITIRHYAPWCQQIQPYLHPDGNLPEGEIDYPCAAGVDQALRNVEGSIRILAKDSNVGAGQ